MSDIHTWAQHPSLVLGLSERQDDAELQRIFHWLYTSRSATSLCYEVTQKLMDLFLAPGNKSAAAAVAHAIELAADAYYTSQHRE